MMRVLGNVNGSLNKRINIGGYNRYSPIYMMFEIQLVYFRYIPDYYEIAEARVAEMFIEDESIRFINYFQSWWNG